MTYTRCAIFCKVVCTVVELNARVTGDLAPNNPSGPLNRVKDAPASDNKWKIGPRPPNTRNSVDGIGAIRSKNDLRQVSPMRGPKQRMKNRTKFSDVVR